MEADFAAVQRIPGAPTPVSLDQCANPTITGQDIPSPPTPQPPPACSLEAAAAPPETAAQSELTEAAQAAAASADAAEVASLEAAALQVQHARSAAATPFILASLALLAIVFGPNLLQVRPNSRKRSGTALPQDGGEST